MCTHFILLDNKIHEVYITDLRVRLANYFNMGFENPSRLVHHGNSIKILVCVYYNKVYIDNTICVKLANLVQIYLI